MAGNQAALMRQAEKVQQGMVRDFWTYGTNITFAALAQVSPLTINTDADAPFVLVKLMYTTTDTSPAQGGALISIRDSGSGRNLFKVPVPISTVCGTGQLPFILPWVHVFPRNGTIEITLTNTGTATQTIYVTLAGYKIIPEANL